MHRTSSVFFYAALAALSAAPAYSQVAFGTMVGNVFDQSGAAVPFANVKVTLIRTNDVRTAQADQSGAYTISTVTPGTYKVEITAQGFRTFVAPDVLVNQNNVVRVDAQLTVGATSESVTVEATTAVLQTDRADIRGELGSQQLMELPQPNRTYLGMMVLMTGTTPPGGQLSGGTNNPSKGMTFAFNGTGNNGATVRIEGVNALNPWNRSAQSFVPSIEAIQNVNIATNANDAEQAMAGGASVNVMLKSGSNQMHGSVFWYNSNSFSEANNFFANQRGLKPPPLNNNNAGGSMGGYIIRNKLFYFGSYEGDWNHSSDSGLLSIPGQKELSGNFSDSANPIYDPLTGNAGNCLPGGNAAQCATDRTPFAGNIIPKSRFDAVTNRIIPDIPANNQPGSLNNYYMNRLTIYNLHKIDTKFDYNVTSKLRLSFRWGKQPYYNFQQPIYGEVLGGSAGFPQSGAGNYLQHGHGTAFSGSANYVASPSLVIDATWGFVSSHQLLFPNKYQEKYGLDTLKIPGSNQGPLPWAGGVPNFRISQYVPMGASYPALEYKQPSYDYVGNVSKIKGAHSLRFGADAFYQFPDHIELRDNSYFFDGSSTIRNGGPGANQYNALADFVLGRHNNAYQWIQVLQPYLKMRWWQYSIYARDQWQVNRKLTLNYGVRWEKYPIPHREETGIYYADYFNNFTVTVCGEGNQPRNCAMTTSNKLFAPSLGIAYRPTEKVVLRAGYSLSPNQEPMGTGQMQAFPGEVRLDLQPFNATYGSGGTLSQGFPIIQAPKGDNGVYKIPPQTGNLTAINGQNNYIRGYFQSYNVTVQKEFKGDILAQVGYVGMHSVKLQRSFNVNYGQVGGGNASLPLFKFGHTTNATMLFFDGTAKYNSLQSTITKRLSKGFSTQLAYTYSKLISMNASILIPEYKARNYYTDGADRTHHLVISGNYALPFGKNQAYFKTGIAAHVLGDWNLNGLYNHWSGVPFTVSASGASCNCPNNSQTADQIASSVGVGRLRGSAAAASTNPNDAYFDVLAYRPVTAVRFGNSGFNQLRGPGNDNIDMSLMKMIRATERIGFQIRGEALNLTNTAHFALPGSNVSNMSLNGDGTVRALNGFGQITNTAALGRIIDQRFFRFSLRMLW
ncbi:MAG: carboxypeptidase regulatory-like domain-containing protein [Bryobacteraceae bacterium]